MSGQLDRANIRGGGTVEFRTDKRMAGGMKHVYFTKDRSGVVAFFHNANQDYQRSKRLEKVVTEFNPTRDGQAHAAYWRDLFCWPTAIVDHGDFGIGIHLPVYPSHFFFRHGKLKGVEKDGAWFTGIDRSTGRVMRHSRVHSSERGNLQTFVAAFAKVARAVHRMHMAGLAHADLSEKNVLIDPCSGSAILIDLDSLVVKGMYPPDVLGTPGYIAPEVLATRDLALTDPMRSLPCASTDKHALAVMIYKYLLERHPLDGRRVLAGLSAEQEEAALYGGSALYSEHRTDARNRPAADRYLPAASLGGKMEELFHRAFVDGLRTPTARPTAGEWDKALSDAFDMLVACPNRSCHNKFFVLTDRAKPVCPYCDMRFRGTFSVMRLTHSQGGYTRNEGEVLLNGYLDGTGTTLRRRHTHRGAFRGPGEDPKTLAEVVFLKDPAPTFYLKNVALPGMNVRQPSTGQMEFQRVPLGAKLQLASGLEIKFGDEPDARMGAIETFHFR